MTADEEMLAQLPPAILAEAQALRERAHGVRPGSRHLGGGAAMPSSLSDATMRCVSSLRVFQSTCRSMRGTRRRLLYTTCITMCESRHKGSAAMNSTGKISSDLCSWMVLRYGGHNGRGLMTSCECCTTSSDPCLASVGDLDSQHFYLG